MNDRLRKHRNDGPIDVERKHDSDKSVSDHTAATTTSPCSSVCSDKAQNPDLEEDSQASVNAEKVEQENAAKIEGLDQLAKNLSFQSQPMTAALGRCLSNNDVRLSSSIHSFLSSNTLSMTSPMANASGDSRRAMANAPFPRQATKQEEEAKKKEDAEKKKDLFDCLDDLLDEVLDIAEDGDAKASRMKHSSSVPTLIDDSRSAYSSNKSEVPRRQTFSNLQAIGEEAVTGGGCGGMDVSVRSDEIDVSWRGSLDALGGSKTDLAVTTNAESRRKKSGSKAGCVAAASVFHNNGSLTPEQRANLEELLSINNPLATRSQSTDCSAFVCVLDLRPPRKTGTAQHVCWNRVTRWTEETPATQ